MTRIRRFAPLLAALTVGACCPPLPPSTSPSDPCPPVELQRDAGEPCSRDCDCCAGGCTVRGVCAAPCPGPLAEADAGAPDPEPDPLRPSPTIPLPPPIDPIACR